MAASRKLKVFRTPTGFHDAYVAAPSQKAALEAWGSDHDLFARGIAELVTDAKLSEEPLANPGKVIKRLRGTAAEQIAALPKDDVKDEAKPKLGAAKAKRPPRPNRARLDAAEAAIEAAERRQRAESTALAREEAALADKRRKMEKAHSGETASLEDARERADAAYRRALNNWQDD